MKILIDLPKPLINSFFSVFLIGLGCLVIGVAIFIAIGDKTMLTLSIMLFIVSIYKAGNILYIGVNKKYSIVSGVCTTINHKLFKKKNEVIFVGDDYKEFSLFLSNKYKLQEGTSYIFYFKNNSFNDFVDINIIGFEKEGTDN